LLSKGVKLAAFIKHTNCEECGSSDGKAMYEGGSSHCFVCEHTVPSSEFKEQNSKKTTRVRSSTTKEEKSMEIKASGKPAMTVEENDYIKSVTGVSGKGFRALKDETTKPFGVRYAYDEDGDVEEQYYPTTQDGQIVGYKIREVPKNFYSKGRTGADCELFMQFKFNRGGKYVLITEGELDALSAYQMLGDYNKSRSSDYETAVVSPTTGANSHKQIAAQYRFFDSFDQIIVCYDNDKAGKEATEEVVKALPKGKVKIMHMRYKDPNTYLEQGKEEEFVRNFYEAKRYTPVGVLGSGELYDKILAQANVPKVPFPHFMNTLNEMLVGGLPLGHIINIAAGTGLGKTSFVNEMVYHWIFNSPHKIGIVSMELDSGQYGETLLGRHLSRKISLIRDDEVKKELLESDKVRDKANELFYNEDGQHRFYLLDNRDGTIEEIQDTVEELVVSCGCRIIVLDPLQDILDGLSNEDQALFMKWSKGIIKSHNVTLIFINHVRKSASGATNSSQGGAFTEEEIQGSSTIIKSASANILLSRNKYAEDATERNTTKVVLSKNRICGLTGPAGNVYYDNDTHTLHNLDDWLNNNN
jgi:KaiC/GvpD/RAD55 family RecA-like ATPase